MWVVEIEPWSSRNAASVIRHRATSPAPRLVFRLFADNPGAAINYFLIVTTQEEATSGREDLVGLRE